MTIQFELAQPKPTWKRRAAVASLRGVGASVRWLAGVIRDAVVAWPRAAILIYGAVWAWLRAPLWVAGWGYWNVLVVAANPAVWAAAWAAWDHYYGWVDDDPEDDLGGVAAIWAPQLAADRAAAF